MFPIAGCRQPAMPVRMRRLRFRASATIAPAPSIAAQRACAAVAMWSRTDGAIRLQASLRDAATRGRASMHGRSRRMLRMAWPHSHAARSECADNVCAIPSATRKAVRGKWMRTHRKRPQSKTPPEGIRGRSRASEIGMPISVNEDQRWRVRLFESKPSWPTPWPQSPCARGRPTQGRCAYDIDVRWERAGVIGGLCGLGRRRKA